ncbi:MAG TPA: hypothetical protein VLI94_13730 [Solirubrobacterales bacterium]|nr:hypothetical protein [Solirubrobacterales bacterium]
MQERHTRNLVRVIVGAALCAALTAGATVPVPEDLPAVAFGQSGLYRLQVALFVFYAGLLLVTPAFSGLMNGRLPIEISTRGARFAEKADYSDEEAEAAAQQLEQSISRLADRVTKAEAWIAAKRDGDKR